MRVNEISDREQQRGQDAGAGVDVGGHRISLHLVGVQSALELDVDSRGEFEANGAGGGYYKLRQVNIARLLALAVVLKKELQSVIVQILLGAVDNVLVCNQGQGSTLRQLILSRGGRDNPLGKKTVHKSIGDPTVYRSCLVESHVLLNANIGSEIGVCDRKQVKNSELGAVTQAGLQKAEPRDKHD